MEKPIIRISVTEHRDFSAIIKESEDSGWYEVLIGKEDWNKDMSENLQLEIKYMCEMLLLELNRNLSLFSHLIK